MRRIIPIETLPRPASLATHRAPTRAPRGKTASVPTPPPRAASPPPAHTRGRTPGLRAAARGQLPTAPGRAGCTQARPGQTAAPAPRGQGGGRGRGRKGTDAAARPRPHGAAKATTAGRPTRRRRRTAPSRHTARRPSARLARRTRRRGHRRRGASHHRGVALSHTGHRMCRSCGLRRVRAAAAREPRRPRRPRRAVPRAAPRRDARPPAAQGRALHHHTPGRDEKETGEGFCFQAGRDRSNHGARDPTGRRRRPRRGARTACAALHGAESAPRPHRHCSRQSAARRGGRGRAGSSTDQGRRCGAASGQAVDARPRHGATRRVAVRCRPARACPGLASLCSASLSWHGPTVTLAGRPPRENAWSRTALRSQPAGAPPPSKVNQEKELNLVLIKRALRR